MRERKVGNKVLNCFWKYFGDLGVKWEGILSVIYICGVKVTVRGEVVLGGRGFRGCGWSSGRYYV